MTRGTTPTIGFRCKGDLTTYTCYITIKQSDERITTFTGTDVEVTYDPDTDKTGLVVYMTQEQTLEYSDQKMCEIQLRAVNSEGNAIASRIYSRNVGRILLDGVIEYVV